LYRAGLGLDGTRWCTDTDEVARQSSLTYKKLNIEKLLENAKETK
jgi:hypothetical protein